MKELTRDKKKYATIYTTFLSQTTYSKIDN